MTLEKGTRVHNRYRIVDILGQGGMGSVYRAIDENLSVAVALKENLFTTDEYSRQFRLEAVILANLRHPNLPRVSDHFTVEDMGQYLVMDFIDGEDLRYRMERVGMLSEEEAIHIGAAMCDALAYLHTRKPPILHRDIKPGNVKISPEGQIYLVDFGLAKVYQSASQATTTGARAMTPGYSPPEQYGTARTDPRTDIYSLGATLYAALTGIIPEDGLARAMENAQLTPLRKRNPKISRKVAIAIERAMAVDPSDRFQTAEDFKAALLSSKSLTQQSTGAYRIAPPPLESETEESHADEVVDGASAAIDRKSLGPVPAANANAHEDQPFVSPLKKQKERERKRRAALWRFVLIVVALLALVGGAIYFMPGVLPADVNSMLSFRAPTSTPTEAPTLAPTQTLPPTFTPAAEVPTSIALSTPTTMPSATPTPTLIPNPALSPTPSPTEPAPVFLGGGAGQIAFASLRIGGVSQIFLADLNGESAVQITALEKGACQPSWSPDGQKLVFISPCKENKDVYNSAGLYIINADGSGLQTLDISPGGNFDPVWSPNGETIAFASKRSGQMEIYLIPADGSSPAVQITKNAAKIDSQMPSWSPDGSQLVYTVRRVGVSQIWMMNADGSNPVQIIRSGQDYNDSLPKWSPRGDTIIFSQRCAKVMCNPYLVSASATDRSNERGVKLSFNVVYMGNASFSPDGFYIAYEGVGEANNFDIFYTSISGGEKIRLTTDRAADFQPVWRPVIVNP